VPEMLRIQGLPGDILATASLSNARKLIGRGTEGRCMKAMGDAVASYLGSPTPALPPARERGRLLNTVPANHLKHIRADSFPGVSS
jgi:hypothetical protein